MSIDTLCEQLTDYLDIDQIREVRRAYFYSEQAHTGQSRRSGEPYIIHPLAVAGVLANMRMDHQSLMAAMLHDVIEDTGVTRDGLAAQFGDPVADLVDGVSKLTHIHFESAAEQQAENFQNGHGDGQRHSRHHGQIGRPPAQHAHNWRAKTRKTSPNRP